MSDFSDPGSLTSAALNRRIFVGTGAGATALAGTIAVALAQGADFGKAHPPLVAEDDPAIAVARPRLGAIGSYAAFPKNAAAATPGIVLIQAVWGIDAQFRDVVRRFAKEGFVAIAPELYGRDEAPPADGLVDSAPLRPFLAKISALPDRVDADVAAAAGWLRARTGIGAPDRRFKIAVTGFCAGGSMAIRQAWKYPARFDAVCAWYGAVRQAGPPAGQPLTEADLAYEARIAAPFAGSYGARDTGILAGDVEMFAARLPVPHDVKIYPEAGHAFFDDTRPSYVASASADAWTRNLAFLRARLAPPAR